MRPSSGTSEIETMRLPLRGGCGHLRYEIDAEPLPVNICHWASRLTKRLSTC